MAKQPNLNIRKKSKLRRYIKAVELMILLVALFSSSLLIMEKTNFLFPSADEEVIPVDIKISNITDTNASLSFVTSQPVISFIQYGKDENDLTSKSYNIDEETQSLTHQINLDNLEPNTTYFYTIGFQIGTGLTASNRIFNYQQKPFNFITGNQAEPNTTTKVVFGKILDNEQPAQNYLIYLSLPGGITASSKVNKSGEWSVDLSKIMSNDLTKYLNFEENDQYNLEIQSDQIGLTKSLKATIKDSQPLKTINFNEVDSNLILMNQNATPITTDQESVDQKEETSQTIVKSVDNQLATMETQTNEIKEKETNPSDIKVGDFAQTKTTNQNGVIPYEEPSYGTDSPAPIDDETEEKPNITPTFMPTAIPTQVKPTTQPSPTQIVAQISPSPILSISPRPTETNQKLTPNPSQVISQDKISPFPSKKFGDDPDGGKIMIPNNPDPTPKSGDITMSFVLTLFGLISLALSGFFYFAKNDD